MITPGQVLDALIAMNERDLVTLYKYAMSNRATIELCDLMGTAVSEIRASLGGGIDEQQLPSWEDPTYALLGDKEALKLVLTQSDLTEGQRFLLGACYLYMANPDMRSKTEHRAEFRGGDAQILLTYANRPLSNATTATAPLLDGHQPLIRELPRPQDKNGTRSLKTYRLLKAGLVAACQLVEELMPPRNEGYTIPPAPSELLGGRPARR